MGAACRRSRAPPAEDKPSPVGLPAPRYPHVIVEEVEGGVLYRRWAPSPSGGGRLSIRRVFRTPEEELPALSGGAVLG